MFHVYYQYSNDTTDGCCDACKDFDSKAEARLFVDAVKRHALKSDTTVDLVVSGDFDHQTDTAPTYYELFICSEYMRETRYSRH